MPNPIPVGEIVHGPRTVLLNASYSYDPNTGFSEPIRYAGILEDLKALTVGVYAPYAIEPRGDGPVGELSIETGAAGSVEDPEVPLVVEWGYEASAMERSLWEHVKVGEKLKTTTDEDVTNSKNDVGKLRKWIADQAAGKVQPSPTLFSDPDIKKMATLLVAGVEAFIVPKIVVTMSAKYTPASTVWMPIAGVGKIFNKTQLTSIGPPYTPSAEFVATLPVGEYMVMSVRHSSTSDGDRMIEYTFDHADKWDPWIYPHT